jgi:hypothetical protein
LRKSYLVFFFDFELATKYDPANEFPRIPLLGSLVNKGQPSPISKRDRSQKLATWPRMYQVAYLDYLVHRLPLLLTDMIGAKTKHRLVVEAKNYVSYRWVPET